MKRPAEGAKLVVFLETFVPGYPLWVWFIPPGRTADLREACVALHANAMTIPSPSTERLCDAARSADVAGAIGVNERNAEAMIVDPDGKIIAGHYARPDVFELIVHRKPTPVIRELGAATRSDTQGNP